MKPTVSLMNDVIHPQHYNQGGIECIDAMIEVYGVDKVRDFCQLSAFKYIWRMDYKESASKDAKKAIWYLNKFLELEDQDE